jgi:hypothetical protein
MGIYVKEITYCHHAYNLIGGHSEFVEKSLMGKE